MEMIGLCNFQLFLKVKADDAADVAVIDQNQRMAFGENIFEPFDDAAAKRLQAKKRRRAVPVKSHGDGLAPVQQVQPPQRVKHRVAHRFFAEVIFVERKLGRDDARRCAPGPASSGAMKMVLPLTCTVYWEAPMTVARMRALGSMTSSPKSAMRRCTSSAINGPRSPKARFSCDCK